jgi:hypothetical protein
MRGSARELQSGTRGGMTRSSGRTKLVVEGRGGSVRPLGACWHRASQSWNRALLEARHRRDPAPVRDDDYCPLLRIQTITSSTSQAVWHCRVPRPHPGARYYACPGGRSGRPETAPLRSGRCSSTLREGRLPRRSSTGGARRLAHAGRRRWGPGAHRQRAAHDERPGARRDTVIYEMHVRLLPAGPTPASGRTRGTFAGVVDKIPPEGARGHGGRTAAPFTSVIPGRQLLGLHAPELLRPTGNTRRPAL